LTDRQMDDWTDGLTVRREDRPIEGQIGRLTVGWKNIQAYRRYRLIDVHIYKQTDEWKGRKTYRRTN
jgi:hypothetical protein